MAHLRAAVNAPVGSAYSVLDITSVPDELLGFQPNDEPTSTERAKHTAVTLYALHQQSEYKLPMHQPAAGLGRAVSILARISTSPAAIWRRFAALGTATTYDEVTFHLRGLVYQLREKQIAIDYGLLADDLEMLQRPGGAQRVRSRWGRDFARNSQTSDAEAPTEKEKS